MDTSVEAGHIGDVVLTRGQAELKNIIRTRRITIGDRHFFMRSTWQSGTIGVDAY